MSDQPPAVCERQFQIELEGAVRPFRVVWMQPVRHENDWRCEYVIEWPHRPWRSLRVSGVDSVQALYLAMQMVAAELYTAEPAVFWWQPDDILELPIMPSLADLEAARTKGRSYDDS